jgi:hypothetical protein
MVFYKVKDCFFKIFYESFDVENLNELYGSVICWDLHIFDKIFLYYLSNKFICIILSTFYVF